MARVPTPEVLWRKSPVLALAALPGRALSRLGEPSTASPAAWTAVGAALPRLHDAPLPPWPGPGIEQLSARLADECGWLVANGVLPPEVVTRNRQLAEAVLRTRTPVFIHGDLHIEHVFIDGDRITGIIDWSEASHGDALFDLATLTLGHREHTRMSSLATARTSTAAWFVSGGRGDVSLPSAGCLRTATAPPEVPRGCGAAIARMSAATRSVPSRRRASRGGGPNRDDGWLLRMAVARITNDGRGHFRSAVRQRGRDSTIRFSWLRSFRFARRIAATIAGAVTATKPDGVPRFRRVIRVAPSAVPSHA